MKQGAHRPMWERFQHIAAALAVRKRATCAMLSEELEVSDKTLQRDIEFMRDRLQLPIEADHEGYYFSEEVHLCRCCSRRVRV